MLTMMGFPSDAPPPWIDGRLEVNLRDIRLRILEVLEVALPAGGWRWERVRTEALARIDEAMRLIENTEVKQ